MYRDGPYTIDWGVGGEMFAVRRTGNAEEIEVFTHARPVPDVLAAQEVARHWWVTYGRALVTGESGRSDTSPARRSRVMCDDPDCTAVELPETLEELRAALDHWRDHHVDSGCSHGG